MTLEVWTTSAFKKSHFKMCHYHFQIIKICHRTWTFFCADVSVIIICDRCWKRREHSADNLIETFVSRIHFVVSTHKVRGRPFREPSRKTELPSPLVQTKINNLKTQPKHIPFPETDRFRAAAEHFGPFGSDWLVWFECWMGYLWLLTLISSGIRTVTI